MKDYSPKVGDKVILLARPPKTYYLPDSLKIGSMGVLCEPDDQDLANSNFPLKVRFKQEQTVTFWVKESALGFL